MKLEILQENLNKALTLANRIITNRPQLPILSNILLTASGSKLTLTASNLETSLVVEVGAKIDKDGEFTVPGRTLTEIIGSLSTEKVALEVVEGSLLVKSSGFHGKVNGIVATEYPKLSLGSSSKDDSWDFDRHEFLAALGKVLFAASLDEGRAALTGVLFKPTSEGLTLVATDGFRLSLSTLKKVQVGKKQEALPLIIPARSLTEVVHILSEQAPDKEDQTLRIYFSTNENQLYFDLGSIKIISRLIAGNFPDYEKIIPSNHDLRVVTSVEELSKAVRLAAIFARESANIVKLQVTGSKLSISANAAQVGENESEIDVVVEGKSKEEFAIAYNFRYLLDFLGSVSGEVSLEFAGPIAPGVFQAKDAPNFLHIIMPVRVQS